MFEYKNEGIKNSKVNIIKSQQNNINHHVYIYLNKSNIDERFINYYKKGDLVNSVYTININELFGEKFYIVISQLYNSDQNNVKIMTYSSNIKYVEINSTLFYKNFRSSEIYIFKFASNFNRKYLKFGYSGLYTIYQTIEFSIYENDHII